MEKQSKLFLFMGLPGSGKGTISHMCTTKLGWIQLSTGNLCREHIQKQTELGKHIDFIIKSGKLVEDEIILEMIKQWLMHVLKSEAVVILDGFPRTVRQAQLLDEILQDLDTKTQMQIIYFDIDSEKIIDRVLYRAVCTNKKCQHVYSLKPGSDLAPRVSGICDYCGSPLTQRSDDTIESIRHRFDIYYQNEQDIKNYYKDHGCKISIVDADRSVQEIFEDVEKIAGICNNVC